MNGFQIVSVLLAAFFCLIVLLGLFRRKIALTSALFWLTVWIGTVVAILNPGLTRVVAESVGITRGADFVFYCAILAMFVGFFLVYTKLRQLERSLTQVVRELAILDAARPSDSQSRPAE